MFNHDNAPFTRDFCSPCPYQIMNGLINPWISWKSLPKPARKDVIMVIVGRLSKYTCPFEVVYEQAALLPALIRYKVLC